MAAESYVDRTVNYCPTCGRAIMLTKPKTNPNSDDDSFLYMRKPNPHCARECGTKKRVSKDRTYVLQSGAD